MMKKIIFGLIISLLLLSSVIALMPPCPIGGRVYVAANQEAGGLTMVLTNLDTEEIKTYTTTGAGEWLVDWANTEKKYGIGQEIEIVIQECKDYSQCQKIITITGDPIFVKMDISEVPICVCPPCPTTTTTLITTTISCPDCICPECPTIPCEECIEANVENCIEFCPEVPDIIEFIIQVVITFIIGAGTGAGIQFTISKSKTGRLFARVTRHKHPRNKKEWNSGRWNYHSIYTQHDDPDWRHPKGELEPKYDENGYIGG